MKFKINYKLILIVLWMALVFCLSGEVASESSNTSGRVIALISKVFGTEFSNMDLVQFVVRKLAHFSLYALGGMLIYFYVRDYDFSFKKKFGISFIIGALYACSDEFHQTFVMGRSGELRDVCIDSLGVLFGITCISLIIKLFKKIFKLT